MKKNRSAWREPMVWLVAGLPIAAVIGSIWLVVVAVRGGADDIVTDKVQRTGQIQTADLSPDARAGELNLGAVVQIRGDELHVFPATGTFALTRPLVVTLLHPQHQAADEAHVLQPDDNGWHVQLTLDTSHDWIVHVTDSNATWRLRGRLPKGQQAAHLGSSLQVQ